MLHNNKIKIESDFLIIYQMLDSIKVVFNGLVSILTGISVDLQALHQIGLHVSVNLHKIWSFAKTLSAL